MNLTRIYGVILRYFYIFKRLENLCDLFYWPLIDIMLWGITSLWLQDIASSGSGIALAVLGGLVFWQVLWRGNYEISVNLLREFWNRNLVNLFSNPLKISEWIIAVMTIGFLKSIVSVLFSVLLVYLLFTLDVFTMGWPFIPYMFSLMLSGWFIGFFSSSFLIRYGQRVQMFAWMTAFLFAPFSAIYYPVSALPAWGQMIAKVLPMSYIFEGMRTALRDHVMDWHSFNMSIILNVIYLSATIAFFALMFNKSKKLGLARLE